MFKKDFGYLEKPLVIRTASDNCRILSTNTPITSKCSKEEALLKVREPTIDRKRAW